MEPWVTIGVGLGSAILAALATGAVEIYLSIKDRRLGRKVAAMAGAR
jgi:hypothetical protein